MPASGPWRILRRASMAAILVSAAACTTLMGPKPPDRNWNVTDIGHFSFYVRPGSFAEQHVDRLSEVLEDQYAFTLRSLGVRYEGRIYAFLYTSAADAGLEYDRSGTGFPATESFEAVCTPPLDYNLFELLSHEANHVIINNTLGRPGTSFVNEGIASAVLSERFHSLGRHFLFTWTRTHRSQLPPIRDLVDDGKWPDWQQDMCYNASASFLAYFLDTYGAERFERIYHASSAEFARRVSEVSGRSLQEVEADWLRFCDEWSG
jgi:hypothetical protein